MARAAWHSAEGGEEEEEEEEEDVDVATERVEVQQGRTGPEHKVGRQGGGGEQVGPATLASSWADKEAAGDRLVLPHLPPHDLPSVGESSGSTADS